MLDDLSDLKPWQGPLPDSRYPTSHVCAGLCWIARIMARSMPEAKPMVIQPPRPERPGAENWKRAFDTRWFARWYGPLREGCTEDDRDEDMRAFASNLWKQEVQKDADFHAGFIGEPVCRRCGGFGTIMDYAPTGYGEADPRILDCWECDGTGVDAARIITSHTAQFNAGIVDRYIARAAE